MRCGSREKKTELSGRGAIEDVVTIPSPQINSKLIEKVERSAAGSKNRVPRTEDIYAELVLHLGRRRNVKASLQVSHQTETLPNGACPCCNRAFFAAEQSALSRETPKQSSGTQGHVKHFRPIHDTLSFRAPRSVAPRGTSRCVPAFSLSKTSLLGLQSDSTLITCDDSTGQNGKQTDLLTLHAMHQRSPLLLLRRPDESRMLSS